MSFPRYPKYKASGVEWLGEVPEHWEVAQLKRLATIRYGIGEPPNYHLAGTPLVRATNIHAGKLFDEGMVFVDPTEIPEQRIVWLIGGDIIVVRSGAYTGDSAIISKDFGPSIAGFDMVLRCHSAQPQFIQFALLSKYLKDGQIDLEKMRAAQPHLNSEELGASLVVLPNAKEQTRIAEFLDQETAKIDELVAEQQRLMELLKEKRQAVISHAVTKGLNPKAPMKPSGNQWLGEVPEHWEVKRLKHVKANEENAFVDGPFGSNLKSEHFVDNGDIYVIESNFATQGRLETSELKTITRKHFNTISRSETREGDIIIAKIGAQYGKSSILPKIDKPAVVSGNSLKLTINQQLCDVKFVNWYLANIKELGVMEDIVNATAQPALSLGEMNDLPMLVPPRAEQVAIVYYLNERLEELDTMTTEAQRAIDLLQERRTALISAAVTGQIDVRNAIAPFPVKMVNFSCE